MKALLREGLSSKSSGLIGNVIQIAVFVKDSKIELLLKDNWFYCLMQLTYTTIQEAQLKRIVAICYAIAKEVKTYQGVKEYLLPGMVFIGVLLRKEKQCAKDLLDLVRILEVIAHNCNRLKAKEELEEIAKGFLHLGNVIQPLIEILSDLSYNKALNFGNNSKSDIDSLKLTIFHIFAMLSRQTELSADFVISFDVLTLLYKLLSEDPQLIFTHTAPLKLLVGLFPPKKQIGKSKIKLLSKGNKKAYENCSEIILNILQSKAYVKDSPPSVLHSILRLLEIQFLLKTATKPFYSFTAQIVSLLLSKRSFKYFTSAIDSLETTLASSPKEFVTILLREGVVNQLKTIDYRLIEEPQPKPQFAFPSMLSLALSPPVPQKNVSKEIISAVKEKVDLFLNQHSQAFAKDKESRKRLEDILHIKNQLILLKDNDDIILEAIDLLANDKTDPITQYEMNQSQIIKAICDYFDKSLNEVITNDHYLAKPFKFQCYYNKDIFHKTSVVIKHCLAHENKLQLVIQSLNNQLSMLSGFPSIEPTAPQGSKTAKFRLVYNEKIFESIQSEMDNLGDFAKDLKQYHLNYAYFQQYSFEFEEKDKAKCIVEMLQSHSHVDLSQIDSDSCFVPRIVLYHDNDKEEEVVIGKEDTMKEALLRIVIKQRAQIDKVDVWDSELTLRFGLLYDIKDENNSIDGFKLLQLKQSNLFCCHSVDFSKLILANKELTSISQRQFEFSYYTHIIFNKGIYISKEASPILYLLHLLHYGVQCFKEDNTSIDITSFNNSTITSLINLQLSKGEVVLMNKLPKWMKLLCSSLNNLTPFSTRLSLFKVVFHMSRVYQSFQSMVDNHTIQPSSQFNNTFFSEIKQQHVVMAKREEEISSVKELMAMKDIDRYYGYVEFQFIEEIGVGKGPTLEFYTNLFVYWQKKSELWMKTSSGALYPKPCAGNEETFRQIGFMIARAIMDDRLFDFPLSGLFFDVVLGRPIVIENIREMDVSMGRVVRELMRISKVKRFKLNNDKDKDLLYEGKTSIENLGLFFVLPGYDSIQLKPQGLETQVTFDNIEEYIRLLYETLFTNDSITLIKNSFIEGINMVFNYSSLRIFISRELEEQICGSLEEQWDRPTLEAHIIPSHGYTKSTPIFQHFISYLSSLSKGDKVKFLRFTTGASRLPLGGFANLNPKFTVVNRHTEHYDNPDLFLPSVLSCQNYLKLPNYSSYSILQAKMTLAMNEGANEFLFS